jgi:hypothetical protein
MQKLRKSKKPRARFAVPGPANDDRRRPEWRLQAEVMARLHKLEDAGWPIASAGDMNAARRTPAEAARAKVTGLTAGEPDVRVYLPAMRIVMFELKGRDGELSEAQKKRHPRLRRLGHDVVVIEVDDPKVAADIVESVVAGWLNYWAPNWRDEINKEVA